MLIRGSVVISLKGRDKDTFMVVVKAEPDVVWVSDGRKRPIQRPKRKNPRHVISCGAVAGEFSMATNREIRRALFEFKNAQFSNRPDKSGDCK